MTHRLYVGGFLFEPRLTIGPFTSIWRELLVIRREVEHIVTIKQGERHCGLSAGTRTLTLRGRAGKITFGVFDPRHIEDVLDRDRLARKKRGHRR